MKQEPVLNNLNWKTASHIIVDKNYCSNEMVFLSFFGIYQVRCQEIGNACSVLMSVLEHASYVKQPLYTVHYNNMSFV